MENLNQLLLSFAVAVVVTAACTPLARRFALKFGMVDAPNPRRINKVPMPTGGGLALFAGFCAASLVGDIPHVGTTALCAFLIMLVGLIDDRWELSAGLKFAGQFLAVLLYVLFGPRIEFMSNPFGGMLYLGKLSIPITMLWVLTLVNIMNFIDGLDGLTAGITLISALALTFLAWQLQRYDAAVLAAIVVGACLGFLPFNFNPAKVYLGDSGALLLGFFLAAISTEGALKGAATIGLSVPVLILALPVTDMLCAVVRRTQRGVPFYQADRSHFHHRLLDLGFSQRQVVFVAYLLTGISASVAVLTAHLTRSSWLIAIGLGLLFWYGSMRVGMVEPIQGQQRGSKDA
jgi:UDP-GlcNAc:undecaprenyl-phosphate GlcNAc-1-phosphate transferase